MRARLIFQDKENKLIYANAEKLPPYMIPEVKLRAAWKETCVAFYAFKASRISLEGDSTTAIKWISSNSQQHGAQHTILFPTLKHPTFLTKGIKL